MTPITYPMRPLNGGSLDKPTAIIPPWPRAYEPKVNGWRVLVHVPTGTCWNRHLEPLTIADEFKPALAKLKDQPSFEWLDCEGLSRRHGYGKGSLVVLDIISLLDDADNVWRDMAKARHNHDNNTSNQPGQRPDPLADTSLDDLAAVFA